MEIHQSPWIPERGHITSGSHRLGFVRRGLFSNQHENMPLILKLGSWISRIVQDEELYSRFRDLEDADSWRWRRNHSILFSRNYVQGSMIIIFHSRLFPREYFSGIAILTRLPVQDAFSRGCSAVVLSRVTGGTGLHDWLESTIAFGKREGWDNDVMKIDFAYQWSMITISA